VLGGSVILSYLLLISLNEPALRPHCLSSWTLATRFYVWSVLLFSTLFNWFACFYVTSIAQQQYSRYPDELLSLNHSIININSLLWLQFSSWPSTKFRFKAVWIRIVWYDHDNTVLQRKAFKISYESQVHDSISIIWVTFCFGFIHYVLLTAIL
jgi:hypothetical protein